MKNKLHISSNVVVVVVYVVVVFVDVVVVQIIQLLKHFQILSLKLCFKTFVSVFCLLELFVEEIRKAFHKNL